METKMYAYASSYSCFNPNDITEDSANHLVYSMYAPGSEYVPENWTYVGTATIVVDYLAQNDIIENKIKVLEQQIKDEYANAERRVTSLRSDINQLRGLTFSGD